MSRPPDVAPRLERRCSPSRRRDAEQVTQALLGEPLIVHERRDGWCSMVTAYDYPGWIREEVVDGEGDPAWIGGRGRRPVQRGTQLGTPV